MQTLGGNKPSQLNPLHSSLFSLTGWLVVEAAVFKQAQECTRSVETHGSQP